MKQQRIFYYRCDCGVKMWFKDGFIPEKFYCTTCEKEYSAKDLLDEARGCKEWINI